MLRATFQNLIKGINAEREAALWKKGILSWEDFENHQPMQKSIFPEHTEILSPFSVSRAALQAGDAAFFANSLHPREHFRIPLEFPEKTIFLDIETTGLSRHYDVITLVGWSYQGRYQAHVRGQDESNLRTVLQDAQVIVTFNGSLFDLPFLRVGFADLRLPPVHIDLRFFAKRVGLSGGQKIIEEILGFKRKGAARDVRGEAAPILWHRYRRGDQNALKLLIEYNHHDIEGMKYIFDKVVSKHLSKDKVPKRIRECVPVFAKPTKLRLVNGASHTCAEMDVIRVLPYCGPAGPAIRLADLIPQTESNSVRFVGIDLTGSAARPTGWCLLDGNRVTTRCLGTDEELIAATLEARPQVVSIDSPLSLPSGRTSVSDDDPGRQEFGIMRYCERILKKRGINVYPALIPSMQKLTARGIRLASEFRSRGIPVIESYPGAAQDIMGIPRKRASLEMLRDGLKEFGVTGEFLERQVTHDELDAITAAIVGAFFWGGRFEALGTEDEEALIIPDLTCQPQTWLQRQVIGISGPLAAGKTTAARHLEKLGFTYARYSMVLEKLLAGEGTKPARSKLQEFGDEIHHRYGQRWLGRRLLESLPEKGNLVIDGLRFPDDRAFLIERFGPAFLHIHIAAPENIRQARFAEREVGNSNFAKSEVHRVESRVQELRLLAHVEITNDASLESFQARVAGLARHDGGSKPCQ
jgi:uncharacterized protein YprB with RNaseH-like and TPR domain/predicted nuclease with RNAse H fold/dephospho-CoA kinase